MGQCPLKTDIKIRLMGVNIIAILPLGVIFQQVPRMVDWHRNYGLF